MAAPRQFSCLTTAYLTLLHIPESHLEFASSTQTHTLSAWGHSKISTIAIWSADKVGRAGFASLFTFFGAVQSHVPTEGRLANLSTGPGWPAPRECLLSSARDRGLTRCRPFLRPKTGKLEAVGIHWNILESCLSHFSHHLNNWRWHWRRNWC